MTISSRGRVVFFVVALAIAMTGLNASKPLVIDDAAFHSYAEQIARSPGDPYGFEIFWYEAPRPANRVLAPPVLPYWWAAAIALFGERPVLWKTWLFPFVLLLVASLRQLAERLAPGRGNLVSCIVLVSPAVGPALNLMLDVPALALAAASLLSILRVAERDSSARACLLAGLLGGLAMQTKYTSVLPFAAGLAYLLLDRRFTQAFAIAALAGLVVGGWEVWTLLRYGESHFVNALTTVNAFSSPSVGQWLFAYGCLLGASCAGLIPLALVVARSGGSGGLAASIGVLLAFASIALLPGAPIAEGGGSFDRMPPLDAPSLIFASLGVALVFLVPFALGPGLLAGLPRGFGPYRQGRLDRDQAFDVFLLVWLAIEVIGVGVLAPFPAMRRMIGVYLVLALALARAASRRGLGRRRLWESTVVALSCGLLFVATDWSDARTRRAGALRAIATAAEIDDGASSWFLGHWGFQYYAERGGLRPVVPARTWLKRGDILLVPRGVQSQPVHVPADATRLIEVQRTSNGWPWSTIPSAYAGYLPIRPQPDAQLEVEIRRVRRGFRATLPRQLR